MALSIVENASLRALNTFGIDARASRLITVEREDDLPPALAACGPLGPALVLGGGSNLLLTRDIDGTVLRIALRGRRVLDTSSHPDRVMVEAAAGEPWHEFVLWTLSQGLYGLENLSLIPGLVGASPIQNIGAYGVEMAEHFHSLTALSIDDPQARLFDRQQCRFGYRDSWFKHGEGPRWIVTAVRFELSRHPSPRTGYGEIRDELNRHGIDSPSPEQVSQAICAIRQRKLPDPAVIGNAGSFFKNPVLPLAQAQALREANPGLPLYPQAALDGSSGAVAPAGDPGRPLMAKVAAAWLIERCGWKGYRDGDAGVHPQHALVLVNHGQASGGQLLALSQRIAESVQQRFGVILEAEPRII